MFAKILYGSTDCYFLSQSNGCKDEKWYKISKLIFNSMQCIENQCKSAVSSGFGAIKLHVVLSVLAVY